MSDKERSAREVFEDHLRIGRAGSVEDDLARNYAAELVVLTRDGVYRGGDGMRTLAKKLREEVPDARFEYRAKRIEGEFALLEWTAISPKGRVDDGVDSYWIRDGRIVAQTIHYTVTPNS